MIMNRGLVLAIFTFGVASPCWSQVLTNSSNGPLSSIVAYGTLMPSPSSSPSTVQVQFRIRSNSKQGYKVNATLNSFTVNTTNPASGGTTVSPPDIGIAITFVDTSNSSVLQPRTDTVAYGFNYNPGSVTAVNGMTSYAGIGSGQATIADLNSTKILSGPRIASSENATASTNFITVTMTFGLLSEYFTPASFTAVVGLTISNGP